MRDAVYAFRDGKIFVYGYRGTGFFYLFIFLD